MVSKKVLYPAVIVGLPGVAYVAVSHFTGIPEETRETRIRQVHENIFYGLGLGKGDTPKVDDQANLALVERYNSTLRGLKNRTDVADGLPSLEHVSFAEGRDALFEETTREGLTATEYVNSMLDFLGSSYPAETTGDQPPLLEVQNQLENIRDSEGFKALSSQDQEAIGELIDILIELGAKRDDALATTAALDIVEQWLNKQEAGPTFTTDPKVLAPGLEPLRDQPISPNL